MISRRDPCPLITPCVRGETAPPSQSVSAVGPAAAGAAQGQAAEAGRSAPAARRGYGRRAGWTQTSRRTVPFAIDAISRATIAPASRNTPAATPQLTSSETRALWIRKIVVNAPAKKFAAT